MKQIFLGISVLLLASMANGQSSYDSLLTEYKKGRLQDESLFRELALKSRDKDKVFAKQLADSIINSLPEDSLYARRNLEFMYDFTRKTTDRGFMIFKNHSDKVEQIAPQITKQHSQSVVRVCIYGEAIQPYITSLNTQPDWPRIRANVKKYGELGTQILKDYTNTIIFQTAVDPFLKSHNGQPDWNLIKKNLKAYGKKQDEYFYIAQVFHFWNNKQWKDLTNTGKLYFSKFPSGSDILDAFSNNNLAWDMFNNCNDPEELKVALKFAEQATLQNKSEPASRDTYANVLYKLGRVDDAIKNQKLAIQLDGSVHEDFKITLEKMQAGVKTWEDVK